MLSASHRTAPRFVCVCCRCMDRWGWLEESTTLFSALKATSKQCNLTIGIVIPIATSARARATERYSVLNKSVLTYTHTHTYTHSYTQQNIARINKLKM